MTLTPAQQLEIAAWSEADRAHWAERSSIVQFDAGLSRDDAEVAAYREVKRNREAKREVRKD